MTIPMRTVAEHVTETLSQADADSTFTEAALVFNDQSRLFFRHRIGERSVQVLGDERHGLAGDFLNRIKMFRLNAKHLDIEFDDGSRWEERLTPKP